MHFHYFFEQIQQKYFLRVHLTLSRFFAKLHYLALWFLVVFYGGHKNLPYIVVVHERVELNSTDDDTATSLSKRKKKTVLN